MKPITGFFFFLLLSFVNINAQEILQGRVIIDTEPVYGFFTDDKYPLDREEIYRRALKEASYYFSAQIYGWSFFYDVGERARGINEDYELEPVSLIVWGDPALKIRKAEFINGNFEIWVDYHVSPLQSRRLLSWKQGLKKTAQANGFCKLDYYGEDTWFILKKTALEDAARSAIREMLRGSERNRPKEASGFISLQTFPRYFFSSGQWYCTARFLVDITGIIPYSIY